MTIIVRIMKWILLAGVVFYLPLAWQFLRSDIRTSETATPVDAVLVFGALVRNETISPLHAQRLDTAMRLHKAGKAETIVVSNAMLAAQTMRDYLLDQGIDPAVIELDGRAEHTPDTCRNELGRDRTVAFVSQTFHLPRLAYQCRQHGMDGQLITASAPSDADLLTKLRVRTTRYTREAGLLWGAILRIYPE